MVEKKINIISPSWKLSDPLILKIEFPSNKKTLYQVWLKLTYWLWRRFWKSSIYFHYLLPLRKVWSLRSNKREPPLSMNSLCKMLKVAQWFLRRRSSDVVNVFMLRLWKRTWPFEESRIPFTVLSIHPSVKGIQVSKWFWRKSHAVVNAFSFFFPDIYLHSKQMWPFILTNLKSIQPQMLCAKSGWNRPSGSVEEDFKMSSMFF